MLTLLKTYGDMLALRKGPDAVPHSWVIFSLAVGMLIISSIAVSALDANVTDPNYFLTFTGYTLGLLFYAVVVFISGYASRMLQTISAIVACGAIITLLYVAEYMVFESTFGKEFASFVGILIIFWSVPVEGHIIARAIQQHPFVGIVIAVVALILQLGFQSAFTVSS